MRLMDSLGQSILFFDGAMGTRLHSAGLPAGTAPDLANLLMPDAVKAIHRAYLDAGSNLLKLNTFVTNAQRLAGTGYDIPAVVGAAVSIARGAVADAEAAGISGPHHLLLDVGPSGSLLAPLGDLGFEDAYALFLAVMEAGAAEGVDGILIETMSDTYELKAAVLAAKETGLPILATVTADASGKLLTGADMQAVAALLSGLRVQAVGLNCGFGAEALLPHLRALRAACDLPLVVNPNAGLPHQVGGKTVFDETPEMFAEAAVLAFEAGACALGGCCGTTPAHIAAMTRALHGRTPLPCPAQTQTVVSSGVRAVAITGDAPILIGERINPTGKPAMKRALKTGSDAYMLREAVRQQEAGVHILDVNAGLPGVDEAEALARLVPAIQSVSDLPLQLDSASPGALARAMRVYNGKPLVNSVSGKQKSLDGVLPLVAKYGGVVVALTLDDDGIPETADGRVAIARRILTEAARYGIGKHDIIFDPLTMAVSAAPESARVALEALSRIRRELGVKTVLGVSNVSFGLPRRGALNAAFFTLAAGAGLSAAIMNPYAAEMMQAYYAIRALWGEDAGCKAYIEALGEEASGDTPQRPATAQSLREAVKHGLREEAETLASALAEGTPPLAIVESELIPALNEVGEAFEKGRLFLPQLLMSAEAAKAAFAVVSGRLAPGDRGGRGTVIVATVQGDIHDIGKNIAKAMLENYRFDVMDLGRDVPPERVVKAVKEQAAPLVGLSALMTTTVTSMEKTIALLRAECPGCRVMVGGAVLTPEYAQSIGADRYVRDAMDSVRYAQEVFGKAPPT